MALSLGPSLSEPEAVLRERKTFAPRLTTATPSSDGLVRLHFHARGAISNLFLEPLPAMPPCGDAEVLLRVRAVGLNFRDVLNVLGEYPGDPGPPGGDAAGMVREASLQLALDLWAWPRAPRVGGDRSRALPRQQAASAVV